MDALKLEYEWLNKAFPKGLPVPSTTIISGPMGAGKPIIAQGFVASWLKAGGSVIAAPLQFPDPRFTAENMQNLYNLEVNDYPGQFVHVQFDYTINSWEEIAQNRLKANLVKPDNWDAMIDKARTMVREEGPGILLLSEIKQGKCAGNNRQ